MNPSQRIIHFRFLENDLIFPISMQDYRALREEIQVANHTLEGESNLKIDVPNLSTNGGFTVAILTDEETNHQWIGIAKCNRDERFVRRLGVNRAVGLANQARTHDLHPMATLSKAHGKAEKILVQYLLDNNLIQV